MPGGAKKQSENYDEKDGSALQNRDMLDFDRLPHYNIDSTA
jgi:hypothetical protein